MPNAGEIGQGGVFVEDHCLGERSLRRALSEYVAHYQAERNHQGKSNVLLFRRVTQTRHEEPVQCRERLGGLLTITIKRRREQLEEWKSPGSTFAMAGGPMLLLSPPKLARLRDQMGLTNETDQIRAADRSGDRGT